MQTFEHLAANRMRVLTGIDEAQAKGVKQKDMPEHVQKLLQQYMPEPRTAAELEEARARDNLSHFVLRLAYCRTAALQKWFVQKEEVLFRHRFNRADADVRRECLLGMQSIQQHEFESIAAELLAVFARSDVGRDEQLYFKDAAEPWTHIYKVPFEQVSDLVRYRQVFLRGGCAYVVSSDTASLAATYFRERLTRGLLVCSDHYYQKLGDEEERLAPLLYGLPMFGRCAVVGQAKALALPELPDAMEESAPLCMRRSFAVLKEAHHLKHGGRWQLGLFLKGIGVSMHDALAFWQREFMQGGTTPDAFHRDYEYNIKHQYGQAGSNKNYRPLSCQTVIAARSDTTCATGCPFKTCASARLKGILNQMKVPLTVVTEAVRDAENKNYQLACGKVYKGLHGEQLLDEVVTHPNQYFAESRKHYAEKSKQSTENEDPAKQVESDHFKILQWS